MTTAAPDGSPPPCYSCGAAIGTPQNVPTFPGAMFGECVACGAGLMAFKDAAGAVVYPRAGILGGGESAP